MKILFAAPERDLLECYKILLEEDFGETVTAFDGTQAASLLSTENFDIVVLDRDIPRIDHKKLTQLAHKNNSPVIVLTDEPVSAAQLTEDVIPNAYLSYPFNPEEMEDKIRDMIDKATSDEKLTVGDTEIEVSGFRIKDGPRLTSTEINVLQSLKNGGSVTTEDGAYISALNAKFTQTGTKTRIKYKEKKGFELVTEDE